MEFNLIVIHEPGIDNYRWALSQVRQFLGHDLIYVSSYQSVILFKVPNDPHEAASKLREALKEAATPIIRVVPVDYVTEPLIDEVAEAVKKLALKIPEGETFRITLEGHLLTVREDNTKVKMHTIDAIRELAKYVDRPVDLTNPSWVIYIRIVKYLRVRRKAAISLVRPEEVARVSA
ncbi:MAG: THUMP domain-containing protein [Desulfurococcales archaeon]|nr:THUMP domain-containing protein [Desulfurococcales archaeon]